MPYYSQELTNRARAIGGHIGPVGLRYRHGTALEPRDTHDMFDDAGGCYEYISDPDLDVNILPLAKVKSTGELHTEHAVNQFLDTAQNAETADENRALRLVTQWGLPALSGAGVELHAQAPVAAGVTALGSFAVVGIANGLRRVKRGQNHLATISHQLDTIVETFADDTQVIRLPLQSDMRIVAQSDYANRFNRPITVSAESTQEVLQSDVLGWVAKRLVKDHMWLNISSFGGMLHREFNRELNNTHLIVDINTSLWEANYKDGQRYHASIFGPSEDELQRKIKDYNRHVKDVAQSLGLELERSKMPNFKKYLPRFRGEDKPAFNVPPAWTDARFSAISLPPALLVGRLLTECNDPARLWIAIDPQLRNLQSTVYDLQRSKDALKEIRKRDDLTGTNKEGGYSERYHELANETQELDEQQFAGMLSIAGVGMLFDRQSRYDTLREQLIETLGTISQSEDQVAAIKLFGIAIDALALQMEPDSEAAIVTTTKLKRYLEDSAPHIDGTGEAYNVIYQGLRRKFPELKLSEL